MRSSNNLKEINMENSAFFGLFEKDKIADLCNHQEVIIFHRYCKSLEFVTIRNMNCCNGFFDDDDELMMS
jgi:hypothetical protein